MKRKSRLLPMSLTVADRSPLLNLTCYTWRSDGVSFRCFGGWLYMVGIIFGNTPFSLSFASLSRRSKAVYIDGHRFPLALSVSAHSNPLFNKAISLTIHALPRKRTCTMFLKCFCNCGCGWYINCKRRRFFLSLSFFERPEIPSLFE
jgi:hypothetical protein